MTSRAEAQAVPHLYCAGRLLRGEEKSARSRYEEDALIGNHTAVWGSFWRDGAWGYACCHQFVKNSYCIGDAGGRAADEQTAQVRLPGFHLAACCCRPLLPIFPLAGT